MSASFVKSHPAHAIQATTTLNQQAGSTGAQVPFLNHGAQPNYQAAQSSNTTANICTRNCFDMLQDNDGERPVGATTSPSTQPVVTAARPQQPAIKTTAQLIREVMAAHKQQQAAMTAPSAPAVLLPLAAPAGSLGQHFDTLPLDTLTNLTCLLAPRELAMLSATCHGFRWACTQYPPPGWS